MGNAKKRCLRLETVQKVFVFGLTDGDKQDTLGFVPSFAGIPKRVLYLLAFGLLIRLVLAWLPEKYFYYIVSDDAYYYFAIAKNLVGRGMLSADGITLTNGFHPLWLFLITPFFYFFFSTPWLPIHLAMTFSAFFDVAAAFLIYKTIEQLGRPTASFWAAAFYLVNPYGLLHTMNGLETAQNNFFLALLVYLSLKATAEWLKSGWFLLGVVCGLALLSRTDNIFALTALLGFLFWRDRNFAPLVKTAAAAALLVLPWLVFNAATFGSVVQTSGTAYPQYYHQQYLNEFRTYFSFALIPFLLKLGFYSFAENAVHYGHWTLTLFLGGVLIYRLKNWPKKYQVLWWTLIGAAAFLSFHVFFRWSVRHWYPQAVFTLTLPAVALALDKLNRHLVGFGFAAALFCSGGLVANWRFKIADRSRVMLDSIYEKIPFVDRVGVFNSGYLQYFTDRKVINMDGLVNNEVLPYYREKKGLEYLRRRDIRWLVDQQGYLGGIFGPYFGAAAESSLHLISIVPDIVYRGNNVLIMAVTPEGRQRPPEGKTSLGKIVEMWRERSAFRKWGAVPWFEWLR